MQLMKKLVLGYVIATALLATFVVHEHLQMYAPNAEFCTFLSDGTCKHRWDRIALYWVYPFSIFNIPLALSLLIGFALKAFKIYEPIRVLYIFLLLLVMWGFAGCPVSVGEVVFNVKFHHLISSKAEKIDLGKVMMGDWEIVCSSDGYDGPVRIKKFDKVYDAVGYPQDGWWGLIFISPDGSYKGTTGSGNGLALRGCVNRDKAIFYNQGNGYALPIEVQDEMKEAAKNGEWHIY